MKQILHFSLLFLLFLTSCSPQSLTQSSQSSLPLEDCTLSLRTGYQVDARCGKLTVSEDRSDPDGRKIELNVAVVPAIKRNPEPDPLFLLAGGPGQSAVETFPSMLPLLSQIYQDRDIVLVDQRGTGASNPLHCLAPEDEIHTPARHRGRGRAKNLSRSLAGHCRKLMNLNCGWNCSGKIVGLRPRTQFPSKRRRTNSWR